ncbi:MAG: hypothetical protein KDE24_37525, partial [Caldilinea sp.]|nr:hypothetical protein [Caldilinea sp.]
AVPNEAPAEEAAPPAAPAAAVQTPTAPAPSATGEPTGEPTGEEGTGESGGESGETPPTTPHVRHRQSQEQLERLETLRLMLSGIAGADAVFRTAMADAGLLAGYLTDAETKLANAEVAVDARHTATAAALTATEARIRAELQVRASYTAFRQVCRTLFPNAAARMALKLDEAIPGDQAGLRRQIETALATADEEPYATQLAAATYGSERIVALRALLGALDTLIGAQAAAQHAAKQATIVRDAAVRDVLLVSRQIRAEVTALLRRYPHLTAPMGF